MNALPGNRRLRMALVGCGQIADAHLQEAAKIGSVDAVAVCDMHIDLARQAAARFHIQGVYQDVDRMFDEIRPDVVHITTPAQTHGPLAIRALAAGCHVYVEKPFTLHAREAETVIAAAADHGRQLCLGHDQLFDPTWLECRARIAAGQIGPVRHIESILGYPISGQFGAAVAGDPRHWVRQLPGGLFQNTVSHPLYRILDLLPDETPRVEARWDRSRFSFPTELWIQLRGAQVTGSLTFSSAVYAQRVTRVYGETGMLEADLDAQTVCRRAAPRMPGAFGRLELPLLERREGARNLRRNLSRFLKSEIHYFGGMRALFEMFYDSILEGTPPPITTQEMLRVTRMLDEVFADCRRRESASAVTAPSDTAQPEDARRDSRPGVVR
jgi:predicted dehydrogenase